MKYYKDTNNNVYAYELDGSQDAFIPTTLIAITESEADLIRNPPLTSIQIKSNADFVIKAQIAELDLKRIRPMAEGDTAYLATLNAQITALRAQL